METAHTLVEYGDTVRRLGSWTEHQHPSLPASCHLLHPPATMASGGLNALLMREQQAHGRERVTQMTVAAQHWAEDAKLHPLYSVSIWGQ